MTRAAALEWVRSQNEDDEIDSDDLDAALVALGYDPEVLRGDDEDPVDRRWDTAAAEVAS